MHQAICSGKLFPTYLSIQSKALWSFLFLILPQSSLACWHLQYKLVTAVVYSSRVSLPHHSQGIRGVEGQLSCLCPAHLEGSSEELKQLPQWEWGRSCSQCRRELWTPGRHFSSGAVPQRDESQRAISGHSLPLVLTLWLLKIFE